MRAGALGSLLIAFAAAGFVHPPPATARPASPAASAVFDSTRRLDVGALSLLTTNAGVHGLDFATGNAGLIYPKGSGKTALFSAGPWLVAKVNGALRGAIAMFGNPEFGPGAMSGGTFTNPAQSYYRVYKVARFRVPSDTARVMRTAAEIAADPQLDPLAHHAWSEYMTGAAPTGAPVRLHRLPLTATPDPTDSVDVLGPDVLGDQMLWCVYNDADPARHRLVGGGTEPLGVEVRQSLFAFDAPGALGNTAFLRLRIANLGGNTLDSLWIGLWSDPDLGSSIDDLVGSDSARALVYTYNGHYRDLAYGVSVPAIGYTLLRGPIVPGQGALAPFALTGPLKAQEPQNIEQTRFWLMGLESDGSPRRNPEGIPSRFWFTGDPVVSEGWLDSLALDRRMVLSVGPLTMAPGDTQWVDLGLVIGQGTDYLSSVANLRCAVDEVRAFYDGGLVEVDPAPGIDCPVTAIQSCPRSDVFWRTQCSAGPPLLDLDQVAVCVDEASTLFDWAEGDEQAELCVTLSAITLDARRRARGEYATLLANACASRLGFRTAVPESVFLGDRIELWAGSLGAKSVRQLAAPAAPNCHCADSLLVALEGQPLSDPSVLARYVTLFADLRATNHGLGIGPTCLRESHAWPRWAEPLQASPVAVTLQWYLGAGGGWPAAIYRWDGLDWDLIAVITPDAFGFIQHTDTDVVPGQTYRYRIGLNPDGREQFYAEVEVTVPRLPSFGILGARPNPSPQDPTISFNLSELGPVTIEVFDLAGRKVVSQRLEPSAPGYQAVRLGADLDAGIYVVRIRQRSLSASAKVVVLR